MVSLLMGVIFGHFLQGCVCRMSARPVFIDDDRYICDEITMMKSLQTSFSMTLFGSNSSAR